MLVHSADNVLSQVECQRSRRFRLGSLSLAAGPPDVTLADDGSTGRVAGELFFPA
jgi:hypothetical protein